MASFQDKWLALDDCVIDRSELMFNNDLLSDVSLVVRASSDEGEPRKSKMPIPAHKFVLSICSPVFFAMFNGGLAEKSDAVEMLDCEYKGMLEVLRYMYIGEAELNENNVIQVLYVAKKYIVKSLADECVQFLQRKLDPENVFCVLSHAEQYDEKVLVDQCWEMIDRETEEAMKSEGFAKIERSLLEAVVKRDTLTIRELELFKAVDHWATKECKGQGLTTDGSVKRCILGEIIVKEIRFPVMEEEEFADVVPDSEILIEQELVNIMQHFNSVLASPGGFHRDKRVGAYQSCFRFDEVWPGIQRADTYQFIHFHVDKDIVLHGIRLFGSESNEYEVTLTVTEFESKKQRSKGVGRVIVAGKFGKFSSVLVYEKDFCYYGFDIMFIPVNLSQACYYSVKVNIFGPDKSYVGFQGLKEVTSHGVTFFFKRSRNCGCAFADFLFKVPCLPGAGLN